MKLKSVPGGWYLHPFEIGIAGGSREQREGLADRIVAGLSNEGLRCGVVTIETEPTTEPDGSAAEWARVRADGSRLSIPNGPRGPQTSLIQQSLATADVLMVTGADATPVPTLMLFEGEARGLEGESLVAAVCDRSSVARAASAARQSGGLPVVAGDDDEAILETVRASFGRRTPPVRGLVLAGGKSTRMGRDKAAIEFTPGVSQARRTADLLSEVCDSVYLSARSDQSLPADVRHLPVIADRYDGIGPVGGMLSAFAHDPQAAWFVVGCDMPLLEAGDVRELFEARNPYRLATCFATPADAPQGHVAANGEATGGNAEQGHAAHTDAPRGHVAPSRETTGGSAELLPEPLCAIYEPKARTRIFTFLADGVTCPRWMLRNGGADLVRPARAQAVYNANNPDDLARAADSIRAGQAVAGASSQPRETRK